MSAPDFYFAVNAIFRHIHDRYGRESLIAYWRGLGQEYYRGRVERWKGGDLETLAADWREYFAAEPQAKVVVAVVEGGVELDVKVCPAIKHLATKGETSSPISASIATTSAGRWPRRPATCSNARAARAPAGNGSCGHRRPARRATDAWLPGLLRVLRLDVPFCATLWGQEAVGRLWAEAIGSEAQQHYAQSGSRAGLRGLYQQWTKTGVRGIVRLDVHAG